MKLNIEGTRAVKFAAKTRAIQTLWRKHEFLSFLLNDYQKEMLEEFDKSDNIMFFWLCSRRIGKTWVLSSIALRQAITKPGSRILYLSTTTDQVNEICDQTFGQLLDTCPDDMRPEFKIKQNKFIFPNGSEIRIKGLDKVGGNAIRGVGADLIIFDEACFMKGLNDILNSVALPMAISKKGKIIFGSTPPSTPGHESIEIIARCEEQRASMNLDIMVAKDVLYSQEQIDEFIRQAGGRDSSVCRREYFCEIITEDTLAILPAFTQSKMEDIVIDTRKPDYQTDRYVSMDIGFRDFTVILFGYWDYVRAKLVIQDEVVMRNNKATTDRIAEEIQLKERTLWGSKKPHKRICDTDPRLIADLRKLSGISFVKTKKDLKEAQVNQTNLMILNNQIEIHPRCKTLIAHCRYGVWNESRTQYHRTSSMGHFDAIDALVYMVRNIDRHKNPLPDPFYNPLEVYHGTKPVEVSDSASVLSRVFSRRNR